MQWRYVDLALVCSAIIYIIVFKVSVRISYTSVKRICTMDDYVENLNHVDSTKQSGDDTNAFDGESWEDKQTRRELARDKLFRMNGCMCRRCNRKEEPDDYCDSDWDDTDSLNEEYENSDYRRDPNSEPEKRSTVLIKAVSKGPREAAVCMIEEIMQLGEQFAESSSSNPDKVADPSVPQEAQALFMSEPGRKGRTPLHYSAMSGDAATTNRLLVFNADPEARTNREETPLHVAASHCHVEVMKHLIEFKADVHARNESGVTPLFNAVRHQQLAQGMRQRKGGIEYSQMDQTKQAVELLLDAGASSDVYTCGEYGASVELFLKIQVDMIGLRKPRASDQSVIDLQERLRECALVEGHVPIGV